MATVKDLSDQDIANIKARIKRGDKYSEIASDYRLNQGRIADFKFGRIRPDVPPASLSDGKAMPSEKGSESQPSLV
jgi:hypothetical protein